MKMTDANVVRLTYNELVEMTDKAKQTENAPHKAKEKEEKHHRTKKPEQPIYQVGAKRQLKKYDADDDRNNKSKQTLQNNTGNTSCHDNDLDDDDSSSVKDFKRKSRRPDIQLYIPKPRQQHFKSSSVSDESSSVNNKAIHLSKKSSASFSDDNNLSCGGEDDSYYDDAPPARSPKFNKRSESFSPSSPGGARTVDMRNQNKGMKVTVTNDDMGEHNAQMSPHKKKQQQHDPSHHVSFQDGLSDSAPHSKQHRDHGERHKPQTQHGRNNRTLNVEKSDPRDESLSSSKMSNTQDNSKHKAKMQRNHNGHREKPHDGVENTSSPANSKSVNDDTYHPSHHHSNEQHQQQQKSPKKRRRRRRKMNSQNADDYCEVFEGMVIENSNLKDREPGGAGRKRRDTVSSGCGASEEEEVDSRERRNSKSSQRDKKNIHLKVTLAQDERYVKVIDKESRSKGHPHKAPDGGNRYGNRNAQERSHPAKRGGLLYLPAQPNRSSVDDMGHHSNVHYEQPGRRGGRSGGGRMLYDPNRPQGSKSADETASQKMQFYDEADYMPALPYHDDYVKSAIDHDHNEQPNSDSYYHHYPVAQYEGEYYMDEPYYLCETQQTPSSGNVNSSAEKVLQEATPIHGQLNRLLSRRFHGDSMWQKITSLREQVQNLYEQVILMDPDLARKQNTEQLLWKVCYYQVIEMLRRTESEVPQNQINSFMQELLNQGTEFYEKLLEKLQATFNFKLENYLETQQLPMNTPNRTVKLALLSAHRSMICLGDLARYKEQVSHSTNYGKARSWYMKSQVLAPKNGRPYNQLAILALYTRRKLDAVYYYMRSLAASNPFWTARESLMSLFDEARKKADHNLKKSKQADEGVQQKPNKTRSPDGERVEIWVAPDQHSPRKDEEAAESQQQLSSLTAVELNKRFVLSYLVVHGKLFTKTGMETFHEACTTMFREMQTLLQHSPSPIGSMRLLQLMAMNMFAIENAKSRVVEDDFDGRCCSVLQEEALQMSVIMFSVILQRCTQALKEHLVSNDYQILTENLRQLFPSIKVWCDWMSCHTVLWNPPAVFKKPENWPDIAIWDLFADFCNVLKKVDTSLVKLYEKQKEGCLPVILNEDNMMTGFVPLLSMPQSLMFVHSTVDMEVARDCLRIYQIRVFGDYLCGIEPPVLKYDVEIKEYVSVADTQYYSDDSSSEYEDTESEEDVVVESDENAASDEEHHIHQLRRKRQELHQRMEHHQLQQEQVQAVFENENKNVKTELEIRPLYLVPDTNCFIDHLEGITQILKTAQYTVVVPLIVITELDGLAKGTKDSPQHSHAHMQMVSEHAREAVTFLEQQFATRNNYLRAITSRGTVMDTILFRSEDIQEEGNNDDTILSCCKHYCKDNPRDYMPKHKAGPIHLLREVVLLTDDRNLRLKAHTCNVPVKDIPAFLAFAKIPKEHG